MNTPERRISPPDPELSGICCAKEDCGRDIAIGEEYRVCESGEIVCADCFRIDCEKSWKTGVCEGNCTPRTMTPEYAREYHRERICDD